MARTKTTKRIVPGSEKGSKPNNNNSAMDNTSLSIIDSKNVINMTNKVNDRTDSVKDKKTIVLTNKVHDKNNNDKDKKSMEMVPTTTTKRVPKKKGKKFDMSKFRVEKFAPISRNKRTTGNFVNVIGLAGGVILGYIVKIGRDHEEEPFLRYVKDDFREGLSDALLKRDTDKSAIVKNIGISLMCPRRATDGSAMSQNPQKNSDFNWMQFVHVLPVTKENTSEERRDFQKRILSYLATSEHDNRYSYAMKFNMGEDLTNPNGPLQVSSTLTNEDAAILFKNMYPINRKEFLDDLLDSEQFDDFFCDSEAGQKAIKYEFAKVF